MPRYDERRYRATHNSYEGKTRQWIPAQLAAGVRCLEFDVWDNDYDKLGDFRLGHFKPGHAVAQGSGAAGENPTTSFLRAWLKKVAEWSDANDHAVITLVLDLKSDLTDNESGGDPEDLNQQLEKAFGAKLYTRDDYDATGAWPDSATLRNRVVCVLSGNANTRASYRYCFGRGPALAVNAAGRVILAYRSGAGDMRYWSGKAKLPVRGAGGALIWQRKGTYAWSSHTVSEPALALCDDGWVVSVYRVGPAPGKPGPALLACRVGEVQEDGWVVWHETDVFAQGMLPSLERESANKIRLVHSTDTGKSLRLREGTLNRAKKKVEWKDAQPTSGPAFPGDRASWKGHELRCLTNAQGMVLCGFDGAERAVGYRQVAFVELQSQEDRAQVVDPVFYGASASSKQLIAAARNAGMVARGWWFKKGDQGAPPSPPQENFAATDFPFDPWYEPYMSAGGQSES